ncbi:hypothetical protein [Liquorilactobacillus uvarum]
MTRSLAVFLKIITICQGNNMRLADCNNRFM